MDIDIMKDDWKFRAGLTDQDGNKKTPEEPIGAFWDTVTDIWMFGVAGFLFYLVGAVIWMMIQGVYNIIIGQ
jgi:hypothetical protein